MHDKTKWWEKKNAPLPTNLGGGGKQQLKNKQTFSIDIFWLMKNKTEECLGGGQIQKSFHVCK